jgi:hypothetical protein
MPETDRYRESVAKLVVELVDALIADTLAPIQTACHHADVEVCRRKIARAVECGDGLGFPPITDAELRTMIRRAL